MFSEPEASCSMSWARLMSLFSRLIWTQEVVGAVDVGDELRVDGGAQLVDLVVDPAGFAQEVLDVGQRLVAQQAGGRVVRRGGEGREDVVQAG